jgi:hypothetical protein
VRRVLRVLLLAELGPRWTLVRQDANGDARIGLGSYLLCGVATVLMLGVGW